VEGGIIEYLEVVCWWGRRGGYVVMGYHSVYTLRLARFCEWVCGLKGTLKYPRMSDSMTGSDRTIRRHEYCQVVER